MYIIGGLVRRTLLSRIQRFFAVVSFATFIGIVLIAARSVGMELPWANTPLSTGSFVAPRPAQVALISGHAGNDSGAVCTDAAGQVTLTEAEVNAAVAATAADALRRAGADVLILDEFDPRLDNLVVDVLVSLHADSCIDASGYKAAYYTYTAIPAEKTRLLACIDQHYPAVTGLPHHPNTVTHDMTEYHAFRKIAPSTPAVILELGFLGGDGALLTTQSERVAQGVVAGIQCFLNPPPPTPTPGVTP